MRYLRKYNENIDTFDVDFAIAKIKPLLQNGFILPLSAKTTLASQVTQGQQIETGRDNKRLPSKVQYHLRARECRPNHIVQ